MNQDLFCLPEGTLDVMIDVETLSTRSDAAIASIGACWFNENLEVGSPIHLAVDLADSIQLGGHVDGDTVRWWLRQSTFARECISGPCMPLKAALQTLSAYLFAVADRQLVRVWGNGADFDIAILATAFAKVGLPLPWRYTNVRCFRTLRGLFPELVAPEREGGAMDVPHNAAHDAQHQALHAVDILSSLRRIRQSPAHAGKEG